MRIQRVDGSADLSEVEEAVVAAGDTDAVAGDVAHRDVAESGTVMNPRLQDQVAHLGRFDAKASETPGI